MRLKNKVCIITGAASGIGRAAAIIFAREGAIVYACDLNEEKLVSLENEAKDFPGEIYGKFLDVRNRKQTVKLADEVFKKHGRIDVLINNAGVTRDNLLEKMSEEEWDFVIDVNLKGVFNMTQAVYPYMLRNEKGCIINTSSVVGLYGNIGQTNYAATKSGVIGMTKTWAKEFTRKGAKIRVNAVAPGFIKTPMTEKIPEKIKNKFIEKIPLKRMGEPEEVAYLYLFLASDEASYINGQVIGVDGGVVL